MTTTTDQKAATARTDDDDLVSRIDAATDTAAEDIDPNSLEAKLRLRLPGSTFWQRERADLPKQIAAVADNPNVRVIGMGRPIWRAHAVWTVANGQPYEGIWQVAVHPDKDAPHLNCILINGPETEVSRDRITIDQALALLEAVAGIQPA